MARKTLRERLLSRLSDMGIRLAFNEDVRVPRGYWSHAHQDCMRWEARVMIPGRETPVSIGSWDSVAECVRRDRRLRLTMLFDSMSGGYEIHAEVA